MACRSPQVNRLSPGRQRGGSAVWLRLQTEPLECGRIHSADQSRHNVLVLGRALRLQMQHVAVQPFASLLDGNFFGELLRDFVLFVRVLAAFMLLDDPHEDFLAFGRLGKFPIHFLFLLLQSANQRLDRSVVVHRALPGGTRRVRHWTLQRGIQRNKLTRIVRTTRKGLSRRSTYVRTGKPARTHWYSRVNLRLTSTVILAVCPRQQSVTHVVLHAAANMLIGTVSRTAPISTRLP